MQRINQEITAPEVRLIGSDGSAVGVVKLNEALRLAEEEDTDLVEIAPNAEPPVVRIMDFGKFKYQEAKRLHEAKLKQKVIQVKEVKFPLTLICVINNLIKRLSRPRPLLHSKRMNKVHRTGLFLYRSGCLM